MFHPVGSQPPTVYWRRRLIVLGTVVLVIVLLAVTISALTSGSSGAPNAQGSNTAVAAPSTSRSSSPAPTTSSSRPTTSGDPSTSTSQSGSPTTSTAPVACTKADLDVQAAVGQSTYKVGAKPKVELQVTNVGPAPCVQDFADKQVLLKVYNGVSRVWGSHDCQIQPGTMLRTLAVGAPVRVTVDWSGTTSQPNCAGRRQKVGAGTYTLYATLSGKQGKATQFTIN